MSSLAAPENFKTAAKPRPLPENISPVIEQDDKRAALVRLAVEETKTFRPADGRVRNHIAEKVKPVRRDGYGWLIAAVLRAAQGSATVATIAAIGIMQSIAGSGGYGVHPIYILIAIGFGSKFLAWMNDAGFWVICRLGGLTQEETLRSWTPTVSIISLVGLIEVLVVSRIFPAPPI